MAPNMPHQSANDLWADAAGQLSADDKQHINFNQPDKLQILVELRADAELSKQISIDKRWKFVRKSGETVVVRDVFEKIVRWVDTFKQIGDIAVQYDATHASLPWAGIRLILQIAVNDTQNLNLVVEGLAEIAELICRYAVTETLYNQAASKADEGLKRAMVKLYASILGYLSKANQYLKQGTAKRMIKSVVLTEKQLDLGLDAIRTAEKEIRPWMNLVDKDDTIRHQNTFSADRIRNHDALVYLLQGMDVPLRRMDDRLKDLNDNLQSK
ncbi:hypothetical protein B5807_02918 [Epicoccum nigrum]|uniref:DUF7708 domain-containing protein n=1 Tax=Epicoccum nigrum TaxID=105696 RepID=A0A1Y2M975_EPING|nr:hypothetical protein B5807_02918 [Epicoccum nigrum]